MVSALVSGSSGPGSSHDRGHCVVFLGKALYSHSASRHPGEWVLANLLLGVSLDELALHPGGSRNTPSHFMLQKPEIIAGLMGHLAFMQTLIYLLILPFESFACSVSIRS